MTDEDFKRLEEKIDRLLKLAPVVEALGTILVRLKDAPTQNTKVSKYEEVGHRRTFVEIGEVSVIKRRKRHGKRGG